MALLPDSWSSLYSAQLARYQAVFESDHNMDAKGGVVMAAILAISVFVLDKDLFLVKNKVIFSMLILGCLIYALSLGLLLYALMPRLYTLPANTTKDRPDYLAKSDEELVYQLIVDTEYAADQIEQRLKSKSVVFTTSTVLFVIGTGLLLVVKLIVG